MPIYILIMLAVVILDQLVKYFVTVHVRLNTAIPVIPHVLSLANVRNYGAAWSMLMGQQTFFAVITIISLIILIYYFLKKYPNRLYSLSFALMIGGTIGNFIDRVRLGYVVDMFQLDFINFPIFNVADSALTVGVILLLLALFKDGDLK